MAKGSFLRTWSYLTPIARAIKIYDDDVTTGTVPGQLVDSTKAFDGSEVGKIVLNTTDGTWARVTKAVDGTHLALDADIMVDTDHYHLVWPAFVPIRPATDQELLMFRLFAHSPYADEKKPILVSMVGLNTYQTRPIWKTTADAAYVEIDKRLPFTSSEYYVVENAALARVDLTVQALDKTMNVLGANRAPTETVEEA